MNKHLPSLDVQAGIINPLLLPTTSRAQFGAGRDVSFFELMATLAAATSPPLRDDEEWGNQLEED